MAKIKPGYRITVASWENDADNYRTVTVDGYTEEKTKFLVDLLKLVAGSRCNDRSVFGNMYEPNKTEREAFEKAIDEVFQKHGEPGHPEYGTADWGREYITDFTGYSEFYTRVVETIIVEYVPEPIAIKDVSKEFGL